jgi:FlaA1/EpsC-like NDP-sugar epimerase
VPRFLFSRGTQLMLDLSFCAGALWLSYQMRFDFAVPRKEWTVLFVWIAILPPLRVMWLLLLRMYRRIWRYFSLDDALVFCIANMFPSLLLLALRFTASGRLSAVRIPLSIIISECGAFVLFSLSARFGRRMTFPLSTATCHAYQRVLLVGSDDSLAEAAHRMRTCEEITVVGLIVWGNNLQGLSIGGFPVLGGMSVLPSVLLRSAVNVVLITDASAPCIAEVVEVSTDLGVDVRILPGSSSIVRGDVRFSTCPAPEVAFGHKPDCHEPHPLVVTAFRDRVVLVTGAGGSIGSELSRQVAGLPISTLILLDQDENSIFELRNELANSSPQLRLISVIGDIRDRVQLERLFSTCQPAVVLHAAAYKHVPVMEENCCEAALNNVIGTQALAEIAANFRAERFLMVSTDKAVRPSSVMGATKRVAELAVQSLGANGSTTRYACVRFGNVLGSRGSVVPIFLRQIQAGGPVTVTDEHMTRYFMTIPDAVRLVLEASTLGAHGDIFMLDMGDPIKIADLARRLIKAAGLRPEIDIEIKFVGKRAGEKIHEQLWSEDAVVCATEFPQVFRVLAQPPSLKFASYMRELSEAAHRRDETAVLSALQRMPIEFRESTHGVAVA